MGEPGCVMMLREQFGQHAFAHARSRSGSDRSQGCVLSAMQFIRMS